MGQGLFPAQPTGVWDAGIMGTLGFGKKGKKSFRCGTGSCQGCLQGVAGQELLWRDGAGLQGNVRAQHNMASDASKVERVRTGSSKSWTI